MKKSTHYIFDLSVLFKKKMAPWGSVGRTALAQTKANETFRPPGDDIYFDKNFALKSKIKKLQNLKTYSNL